jgi:Uma2 family endonuclease
MAEPVRKISTRRPERSDRELPEREPGIDLLRWVEGPNGETEQLVMPLTPELFLNPQVGDQMTQGKRHGDTAREIADLLEHFFRSAPDVLITFDLKHLLGPGLPQPGPDVSVIRGVRDRDADRESFDVEKEGVRPCLIVEVVSPLSSRIRQTDLVDKVDVYRRAGISEYLIADSTRRDRRFRLLGYRLEGSGPSARYEPIEPDDQGRVLSETTGLWFQVSPDGDRILLSEEATGQRLLTREEEEILLAAAEERVRVEAKARRVAEEEVVRLRAELDRLRSRS